MFTKILRSRAMLAAATAVATTAIVGGVQYVTAASTPDTFYACATISGTIRTSTIRLNSAPAACPKSTDHVVSWVAAGQTPQAKAVRMIDLGDPNVAIAQSHTYPAADTSDCEHLEAAVVLSDLQYGGTQGGSLNVGVEALIGTDPVPYTTGIGASTSYGQPVDFRASLVLHRYFQNEPIVIPAKSAVTVSLGAGAVAATVVSAQLVCTPY